MISSSVKVGSNSFARSFNSSSAYPLAVSIVAITPVSSKTLFKVFRENSSILFVISSVLALIVKVTLLSSLPSTR